jgi:hypothetical protein
MGMVITTNLFGGAVDYLAGGEGYRCVRERGVSPPPPPPHLSPDG